MARKRTKRDYTDKIAYHTAKGNLDSIEYFKKRQAEVEAEQEPKVTRYYFEEEDFEYAEGGEIEEETQAEYEERRQEVYEEMQIEKEQEEERRKKEKEEAIKHFEDKIKVGDIVQYAHPNADYEAKVVSIKPNKQFKGMSKVQLEWLGEGRTRFGMKKGEIQDAFLEDLMLSKKRYARGGSTYAEGGEIESVAKAIYEPNEHLGGIETSMGKKTLKGLENMIKDNDAYDVYVALGSNFEQQPEGGQKIATTYGDKTMKGLIAMIENAKGGSTYAEGGEIPSKIKKEFDKKIKNKKFAKAYLGVIEDEDDYEWSYKSGLKDYFEEWKNDNETFKIHNEIRRLKAKGLKNVYLNGFEEHIQYVVDRKYNDYEIKKHEEGSYSTTLEKGGSTSYAKGGETKFFDKKGNPTKEYIEYRKKNLQKLKDEHDLMVYHDEEWESKQEYLDYQRDLKGLIREEEDFNFQRPFYLRRGWRDRF